ncbi:Uncharacterised protein [Vibrio cholerae]|nr:Uncharacterised protein [Vibrio cholerae]
MTSISAHSIWILVSAKPTANAGYKQVNVHFNQKSVSGYKRF